MDLFPGYPDGTEPRVIHVVISTLELFGEPDGNLGWLEGRLGAAVEAGYRIVTSTAFPDHLVHTLVR